MASNNEYIIGQCLGMCPAHEIITREREKLLHILEVVPGSKIGTKPKADKNRMVKSFCRSAAGKLMHDPKNLRPPNVLMKTVEYLVNDVCTRTDLQWYMIYDFVMDRFRSVRQDMVIQNISRIENIRILQPIIKFYAYAAYKLCEEDINKFDAYINNVHLQECLKRLLCMYDDIDLCQQFNLPNDLDKSRSEFEALYIIFNLGDPLAIMRGLQLEEKWRTGVVKSALTISFNYLRANFIRVCKMLRTLPTILAAAAFLHLPEIRRKSFQIMAVAYNSRNLRYSINHLKHLLLYDCELMLISDCKYYGLNVDESGICFLKTSFDTSKSTLLPKHINFIDNKLKEGSISDLILSK